MTGVTQRSWVLFGFAISLISVAINTFVISSLNDRLKEVDSENAKLNESLTKQATELNRAEIKLDLSRVMHHVAGTVPNEQKQTAREESAALLKSFLTRNYAAEADVPPIEMIKLDIQELSDDIPKLEKLREINQKLLDTTDLKEQERLLEELKKMDTRDRPLDTELAQKVREIQKFAQTELKSKDDVDFWLELFPVLKQSKENIIKNIQTKQARIKELEEKRGDLSKWINLATYAAISLQLFGLMFVLTKDLVKDTKERREKAEKEAKKAEEEAAAAKAEAEEAQEEADEYQQIAEEARADAEKALEEAGEAEQLLADLREEVKLAIERSDEIEEEEKKSEG